MNTFNNILRLSMDTTKRCLSTFDRHLELTGSSTKYFYIWLRDHCRCSDCFNSTTQQIASDINKIPLDVQPEACNEDANQLNIIWKDGHKSHYNLNWLKSLSFKPYESKRQLVLWDKSFAESLANKTTVQYDQIFTNDGVKKLLESVLKYGFGFVEGAQPTREDTAKVSEQICFIRKTLFGEVWAEVLDNNLYSDTAYTNEALGAHNDNTYFTEASGLQIFHILSHDGTGGETILVDGFNAATNLQKQNLKAFEFLCNNAIEAQYIEEGVHYSNADYVIKLHPINKNLQQIRYNIYDRVEMTNISENNILNFYTAYKALGDEINKPSNEWKFKLMPGTILFIDNWRVLHGRTAYTGKRRLTGCYLSRGPWLSRAKALGLEID